MKLADSYWQALASYTWIGPELEILTDKLSDKYEEKVEWLCSIANDTHRVTDGLMEIQLCNNSKYNTTTNDTDVSVFDIIAKNQESEPQRIRKQQSINARRNSMQFNDPNILNSDDEGDSFNKLLHTSHDNKKVEKRKHSFFKPTEKKQISTTNASLLDQAYTYYAAINNKSLEFIASIMFKVLFSHENDDWKNPNIHELWLPDLDLSNLKPGGNSAEETSFTAGLQEILFWIQGHVSYLQPWSLFRLIMIIADRVCMRYIHMLKIAYYSGRHFEMDGCEINQIELDIYNIKISFDKIMRIADCYEYMDTLLLSNSYRFLECILNLLQFPFGSSSFMKSLDQISRISHNCMNDANAIAVLTETIILLRADAEPYGSSLYNNVSISEISKTFKKTGFFSSMFSKSPKTPTTTGTNKDDTRESIANVANQSVKSRTNNTTRNSILLHHSNKNNSANNNNNGIPKRIYMKYESESLNKVLDILDEIKSNGVSDSSIIETTTNKYGDSRHLITTCFPSNNMTIQEVSELMQMEINTILFNEGLKDHMKPIFHDIATALVDNQLSLDNKTNENLFHIQISNIKLEHIISKKSKNKKIKPFLTLTVNETTKITEIAKADVMSTDYIITQNADFYLTRGGFNLQFLHCELYLQGVLYGSDKLGYVDVSFANLQAVDIESQSYTFLIPLNIGSSNSNGSDVSQKPLINDNINNSKKPSSTTATGVMSMKMPSLNITIRLLNRFSS